jgi:outer membrane receptor protein involved in Fe transport
MQWSNVTLTSRYSVIDATFRSGYVERSPANSGANAAGDTVVAPGDRIPGIPRQTLRLRAELALGDARAVGATLVANGASRLRGDESNQDVHGAIAGFAVLNIDGRWRVGGNFELFARVANVFDRRYATFGVLGSDVFANPAKAFDPAHAVAEPFYGLGAPRGVWVGVRTTWR